MPKLPKIGYLMDHLKLYQRAADSPLAKSYFAAKGDLYLSTFAKHRQPVMDDFSITRPEPLTPARDSGGSGSPRGDAKERRRPRETPEVVSPEKPETLGDDETSHQLDELA